MQTTFARKMRLRRQIKMLNKRVNDAVVVEDAALRELNE